MAVFTTAPSQGRDHGMTQPRNWAAAFAAVVQRIFLEGFSYPVARSGSNSRDPEAGSKPLAVPSAPGPTPVGNWSTA